MNLVDVKFLCYHLHSMHEMIGVGMSLGVMNFFANLLRLLCPRRDQLDLGPGVWCDEWQQQLECAEEECWWIDEVCLVQSLGMMVLQYVDSFTVTGLHEVVSAREPRQ